MSVVSMGLSGMFFSSSVGKSIGRMIYTRLAKSQERNQTLTTVFFRALDQASVFEGPLRALAERPSLTILVAGCSLGCEAYSLAGYLTTRFPQLDLRMTALDIDAGAIAVAKRGVYDSTHVPQQVFEGEYADVARRIFKAHPEGWEIVDSLRERIQFSTGDVLSEAFRNMGAFDLVTGQNFLIHMQPAMAEKGMEALVTNVKAGGYLFVGGVDLDVRVAMAKLLRLSPLDWRIERLHNEDVIRRNAWPFYYWGLEPMDATASEALMRYGTIFRKS